MNMISRNDAKARGAKRYFTGFQCKRGHLSERYTINGRCVSCAMDSYQHGKDRMIEMSAEEKKESRDHILARKARYREKNRKLIRERDAQYREDNKLELSTRASRHYQKNRDREIERCTQHASTVHAKRRRAEMYRYRYMVDPEFRCAQNMRWIVKRMAKSDETKERKRTREALGYSAKELKEHLEKQFQPGMSWDNHGEWHIDHIIPISAHIQSGETNPKVVNCLTNLRPMWAKENISKGGSRTHLL